MEKDTVLGVIGGLGPMATAHFMELVVNMTEAASDYVKLNEIMAEKTAFEAELEEMYEEWEAAEAALQEEA